MGTLDVLAFPRPLSLRPGSEPQLMALGTRLVSRIHVTISRQTHKFFKMAMLVKCLKVANEDIISLNK
jgi:hypothetical protein